MEAFFVVAVGLPPATLAGYSSMMYFSNPSEVIGVK
jgi:hypothetical protein